MFTGGVGAVIDLPNFSVLVRGTDDWRYDQHEYQPLTEPRLLRAVQALLRERGVKELRPAPWQPDPEDNPTGPASRIGVPVLPFP